MNDYDVSSVWDYEISCHDINENVTHNMQDTYDLDEEYSRDSFDYAQLAYTHYAWYTAYEITSWYTAYEIMCTYTVSHILRTRL